MTQLTLEMQETAFASLHKSPAEFITAPGQYKISPFQYTAEEVLEDLAKAS